MGKLKKKFGRRILAYILSGAMIMSNMTAFASEPSNDTSGYYEETVDDAVDNESSEEAEANEASKSESDDSDGKDNVKETLVETVEATETETSDKEQTTETSNDEQASEMESSASTEAEETKSTEKVTEAETESTEEASEEETTEVIDKDDDVKAEATHTFDATQLKAETADSQDLVVDNEEKLDKYFSVTGSVKKRIKDKNEASFDGTITSVEVGAVGKSTINFTVTGTADVELVMSSTGGSNKSAVGLADASDSIIDPSNIVEGADGTVSTTDDKITIITGTKKATIKYTGLSAGTYKVLSPTNPNPDETSSAVNTTQRGARVFSVKVTETTSGEGGGEQQPDTTHTSWKFSDASFQTEENATSVSEYNGLKLENAKAHNKQYLYVGSNGKVSIPVAGNSTVTVKAQYGNKFYFADKSDDVKEASGADIATYTYEYTGKTGYVVLTVLATTYLTEIKVEAREDIDTTYTSWKFSDASFQTEENATSVSEYNGLKLENAKAHNKQYLYVGSNGKVSIPVAGNSTVTVKAQYGNKFYFADKSDDVKEASGADIATYTYKYTGDTGYVVLTVLATTYLTEITVEPELEDGGGDDEGLDTTHIAVWDFNADKLDEEKYINMLTAEDLNNAIGDVEGGQFKSCFTINGDDQEKYLEYSSKIQGSEKNTRLYADNPDLNSAKLAGANTKWFADVCKGALYVNAQSPEPYISIYAKAGDVIQVVAGGNNGDSTVAFEQMNVTGAEPQTAVAAKDGATLTFYAVESGQYKIYSVDEKLVVGRITREHTAKIKVSGTVTAPENLKNYSIAFKCRETGAVKTAKVIDGKYSYYLNEGYTYDVSLANANGYIVKNEKAFFTLAGDGIKEENGVKTYQYDVTVEAVDLVTVTGSVEGMAPVAGGNQTPLKSLKLGFESNMIYEPELTLNKTTGAFTIILEKGVEYTVIAEGVDDFKLVTEKISASEDGTQDISFEAKPVYNITINPKGATKEELATTNFVFSRVNVVDDVKEYDTDYVYTFAGTEGITLRDGQYEVKAANCPFTQELTSDLKVNGQDTSKDIKFNKDPITLWNFADADFTDVTNFKGLLMSGVQKNKTYALGGANGEFKIPVSGPCTVTAYYCYEATGSMGTTPEDAIEISLVKDVDEAYHSTSKEKPSVYEYTGEAGYVTINTTATTYMTKITVTYAGSKVEYKEKVTVGVSGCDYTSINDALDVVRKMDRTADQRVTIEIQPGDYEEMLVVDTPNVTLKNANSSPSIKPINKGVDIDASSVRITSYYGHGYAYYSMGNDCKWDADILEANKENGSLSFINPGSGTTSGSFWNATVVIGADGFEADGIIFENSFNQYISKKAADDVIIPLKGGAKEGDIPRASMKAGDTTVQNKKYVERAAALAIMNEYTKINFNNCSFIGRQDTLYGGTGVTAAFYNCDIYGGTDYIFGGMTAVFAKCDLLFNTMEDKNDVGYITAAQQSSGRGYLMYNCTVTSTTPGVNTASEKISKPGYFGRPWAANTGEALFYKTIIEKTNYNETDESLITAAGWNDGLSGKSGLSQEYASIELAGIDNSSNRVAWSKVLTADAEGKVTLADGNTVVTDDTVVAAFFGDWNPFAGKDMTIETIDPEKYVYAPVSNIATGTTVSIGTEITLTSETKDAEIYYTTDGSDPITQGVKYEGTIIIDKSMVIKAVAKKGDNVSEVSTFEYIVSSEGPDEPIVVTTININDCKIAVSSILEDAKKNPDNMPKTSVVYEVKDAQGKVVDQIRFAEGLDYEVSKPVAGTEDKVWSVTLKGKGRAVDEYRIDPESTVTKTFKVFDKKADKDKIIDLSKAKITLDGTEKGAIYTGYAQRPEVTKVMVGKDEITADKYKVSYKSNTNAGKASIIISADSDAIYAEGDKFVIGTKTVNFTIKKAAINKADQITVTAKDANGKDLKGGEYDYRGVDAVVAEELSVATTAGRTLRRNVDYTATYKNNRKAGKASLIIKGIGNNLSGSLTISYTIKPLVVDPDNDKYAPYYGFEYSPNGAKAQYVVLVRYKNGEIYDEILLEEGVDFKGSYKYSPNKEVGSTVTFSGKGMNAFQGMFTSAEYPIKPSYFADGGVYVDSAITVDVTKADLDGDALQKALEKAVVLKDYFGTKLKVKKDYNVEATVMNGRDVVIITPSEATKANYADANPYLAYYYNRAKNIAKLSKPSKVEFAKDFVKYYDGRNPVELTADDIKQLGTYEFELGEHIEIVEGSYKNNYKAGTASVTIRGIARNGYYGTKTIKFKIVEA